MNWTKIEMGYKAQGANQEYTVARQPGAKFRLYVGGDYRSSAGSTLKGCKAAAEALENEAQTTPADLPPPPEPDADPVNEPTPLESAPDVQPAGDPDLDIDHVAEPMPVYAPAPTVPAPMSEPEPDPRPDTGVVDRDSVDATLNRLVMYRDLKWLPRARTRPVKRYADVRA